MTRRLGTYHGLEGYCTIYFDILQVKVPVDVAFKPLREALTDQELFILTDFGKFERPAQIHLAYLTMHEYRKRNGGALPKPWSQGCNSV